MNLYDKIKIFLDYNSSYSIKKAISILQDEFKILIKNKNTVGINHIIVILRDMKSNISDICKKQNPELMQKAHLKKIDKLISYITSESNRNGVKTN